MTDEEVFIEEGTVVIPDPEVNAQTVQKVGQDQIHGLLFSDKLSWQAIIYELINTEQLDPWDIDIALLANKYLDKIRLLEESDFFISSKVLLAAALLLRMKSEILLDDYIAGLDAILFGRKDQEAKKYIQERIELDEEIPSLVAKSPLPRFKKVTLEELMSALGQAINTETRRIRKVTVAKQQEIETAMILPKKRINIQDKIKEVYEKLNVIFESRGNKLAFSEFAGATNEDRVATFIPLLHLDNQHKVWLEQGGHFEEIWILLKSMYEKQNATMLENMRREVEEELKSWSESMSKEDKERAEEMEEDFTNSFDDLAIDNLEGKVKSNEESDEIENG